MIRISPRAVALLAIVMAAVAPNIAAPSALAVEGAPDATGLEHLVLGNLGAKIRAYHVQMLDRDALVDDSADGRATLTLYEGTSRETSFDLLLAEKRVEVVFVDADSGQPLPLEYAPRTFRGSVDGLPGSRVLLNALATGVSGFIWTSEHYVQFEPLGGFQAVAPVGATVVFDTKDLVPSTAAHEDPLTPIASRLKPSESDGLRGGMGVLHTARRTDVGLDYDFYSSTAWSSWQSKASDVGFRMDSNFESSAGWSMVGSTLYYEVCTTSGCDASHGMDGATCSATLANFADHSDLPEHWDTPWQFRHHLTARDVSGCLGIAYIPGRYGITQVRNSGPYDGATSGFEAAQVMSQEIGHNLNAQHSHGSASEHDHGSNHLHPWEHCHAYTLGVCTSTHTHYDNHWHADVWRHADIMKSGYCFDANDNCGSSDPSIYADTSSKGEWFSTFTSAATSVMDTCNHDTCYA